MNKTPNKDKVWAEFLLVAKLQSMQTFLCLISWNSDFCGWIFNRLPNFSCRAWKFMHHCLTEVNVCMLFSILFLSQSFSHRTDMHWTQYTDEYCLSHTHTSRCELTLQVNKLSKTKPHSHNSCKKMKSVHAYSIPFPCSLHAAWEQRNSEHHVSLDKLQGCKVKWEIEIQWPLAR